MMIIHQVSLFADLFSALILLLLLLSTVSMGTLKHNSTRTLVLCMILSLIAIISDSCEYICEGKPELDTLFKISLCITLLLINIIEGLVGVYINCYVNEHKKEGVPYTYRFSFITLMVEAGCFILTLILLITGNIFLIEDGVLIEGELYIIPYVLDATASIFMIGYVLSHTQFISTRDVLTLMTVVVFTAIGYLLDAALPGYSFSVMFGIIAILLNFLLVKEREILDLKSEEENKFRKRVQAVLSLSENFEIIFLVNLESGRYKFARTTKDKFNQTTTTFTDEEHFLEKNKAFIMEQIHPEDRLKVLDAISTDFLVEQFKKSSEYTISYRLLKDKKEVWYKMRIRPEKSWPERHKILIGIFNNDEEYRKERHHEIVLERQLERYSLIHNIIGSGSWTFFFDSSKKVYDRYYSDEIIRMLGFQPPATPDFDWEHIMHPGDLIKTRQALHQAISDETGKTFFEIEHRMRNKDGSYHWYKSSGRILLNKDGSGELLGTHVNIDAIHEKDELQILRDRNFQFMQLRTEVLNFIATQDCTYEKFFDFFSDSLFSRVNCDQVVFRRTDGYILHKERDGITLPPVEVCDECKLYSYISRNCNIKGEYCFVGQENFPEEIQLSEKCPVKSLLGYIIYSEGIPKGYFAIHFMREQVDFSDTDKEAVHEIANLLNIGFQRIDAVETQRLDFERYRLLHAIVHSGMWSYRFNKYNEIYKTEYSDELLALIGWDRNHMEENSTTFQSLIHPDDYDRSTQEFTAAMEDLTGQTIFDSEYRMRNEKGEYHWFRSAGCVIRYKNGYGEFFGTHINIDAEKKREELQSELEIARDNAEAASAAKTAFLFNMSHDIRTPLNAIIGFTDIALTHRTEADKVNDYLTKVKSSSDFLLTIVNDVLDMSRIEAGKTQIEEDVYCITDEAAKVSELNVINAKQKNITFISQIEDCTIPYVVADAIHIKQVVVNILNNAIKYTPAGGKIWYTVREEKGEAPDEVIVHSIVKDNGIGMEQKFLDRIYEAFEREQTSTQSGIQGTGLGMSIVKRLTDLLHGTIKIDTNPGQGTTVSVSFVHKIATEEQIADYKKTKKQKEEAEMKINEKKLIGKRLLLVEDNELNREISEQILKERGLVIETAINGQNALDIIKEKGVTYYDFVLMDIQMPVMDGYAATQEIRKLPGADKLPIAAFSANAFVEDKRRSLEAGMNIHVAKPINIKELTRSLASLL